MTSARDAIGTHDVLFVTLDSLRYDVADEELREGRTPVLASVLGPSGWEARHSPGSFTYAAHHAFFAGFLPTPIAPEALARHARPFAARFEGSRTTGPSTWTFDEPDLPSALAARGYRTACIGGVGFFNRRTALGRVLPSLFAESHWEPSMGVASPTSTARQVALAVSILEATPRDRRVFLFLNVSAIHTPNRMYVPGARTDSLATHAAALRYVDGALGPLFSAFRARGSTFAILTSDHGTAYGEDGYDGHRVAHPAVWTVPYAQVVLEGSP